MKEKQIWSIESAECNPNLPKQYQSPNRYTLFTVDGEQINTTKENYIRADNILTAEAAGIYGAGTAWYKDGAVFEAPPPKRKTVYFVPYGPGHQHGDYIEERRLTAQEIENFRSAPEEVRRGVLFESYKAALYYTMD